MGLIVTPIALATLLIMLHSVIKRKTLCKEYKFILLLLIMLLINTERSCYYFWHKWIADTTRLIIFEDFFQSCYYLQPLTTWLFVWQYFDAVTSLIKVKMPKPIAWALHGYYSLLSLALIATVWCQGYYYYLLEHFYWKYEF